MPNASHRTAAESATETARPHRPPLAAGTATGLLLSLGLAFAFTWWNPAQNRWAALALVLALGLDVAARIVARAVRQRTGVQTEVRGVPSPLLALGNAAWIGALVVAAVSCLRPELFPLLASALAGLVAMGACARLALARMVVAIEAAERAAIEAKRRGEGTGR